MPLSYFSGHQAFASQFDKMKAEIMPLLQKKSMLKEFGEVETYSKRISSPKWQCFFIKCYGKTTELAKRHLPLTSKLVENQKEICLAMVSILEPGASIPPHWGPSKACLRYHLTIECDASEKAFITVENKRYHWKEGDGVIFDDTYKHSAENPTNSYRVVLFCDIERKLCFPFNFVNRFLLKQAGKSKHLKQIEQQFADFSRPH